MENKKQLIIIPPMSEPVKKLHEILEGIAGDENFEISLIDDVKELSQFIATTGQCIILASNAKKCATFLQDNKTLLQKNHCKTILFTPKEIPQKTLIKFTKVGLTESILESTPPKTFLYKVKLLLRSIKTAKPQEEAEKVVKSLDVGKAVGEELTDKDIIKNETEENVLDLDLHKKKKFEQGEENVVDYSSNLKGKIKPQEEAIETHWKSDRKKHSNYSEEEKDSKVENLEDENNIDMYLRGKNKKNEILEPEELPEEEVKEEYIGPEKNDKKRKSNFQDIIDEGSMKQKKLGDLPEEDEEKNKDLSSTDLDLLFEEALKKQKRENIEAEEEEGKSLALAPEEEPKAKKERKSMEPEDLGGHLKGKITQFQVEESPEDITEEKEYDNSELGEKREKNKELDLEAGETKKSKKDQIELEEDKAPHEGEVDKIDNNLIGDEGTVDKIRTMMEGKSNYKDENLDEESNSEDLYARKKKNNEENDEKDKNSSLDLISEDEKKSSRELKNQEEESELTQKKNQKLDLKESQDRSAPINQTEDDEEKSLERKGLIEKITSERERELAQHNEDEKERRERDLNNVQFAKTRTHTTHTGNVDKIDSFMRGGEAKKKEHSWDNLTEKTTKLELIAGSKKNGNDNTLGNGNGNDLGEQTIDYRKLKEEFDLISLGADPSNVANRSEQEKLSLRNDEDDGSFKVIEVDSKSLDYSIHVLNSIYTKETKPKQILAMLANEILSEHKAITVFFSYKLSDKKLSESYNTFLELSNDKVSNERKEWWLNKKKNQAIFDHYLGKSMTTWRCEEIVKNDQIWEDVELPSWAEHELKTKACELIFPYFDGIDRMGMAFVYFPEGINPNTALSLLTLLEMARTVFLDTIERYKVVPVNNDEKSNDLRNEKVTEEI